MNKNSYIRASLVLALTLISNQISASVVVGFNDENPDVNADLNFLSEFNSRISYFLPKAELSRSGYQLAGRIDDRFPIIVHENYQIKACSKQGRHKTITSCDQDFRLWKNADMTLIPTPIPGIWIYSPYLEAVNKDITNMMIGLDKNRLLTVDSIDQVILVIGDSFLDASSQLSTEAARRHFRISGYVGAARIFDAMVMGKNPLRTCNLGMGFCDEYRDGSVVQSAAYLLTAANECNECSSVDKVALINAGIKLLTGAPVDANIDIVELIERFKKLLRKSIIPKSLYKQLRDDQIMMIGISPSLD